MTYLEERRLRKEGLLPPLPTKKEKKPIKKVSDKKREQINRDREDGLDGGLDKWFEERRKELIGTCQCGCGQPSQKKDDTFYRGSCCHIFPKATFKSISAHPLNFVERAMFGGCHSNMDNKSIDLWPNMADWFDIKEKITRLIPFIRPEEKKHKLYQKITSLIYTQ